jgi:DNA-binding CsgD family transcriptional regulator
MERAEAMARRAAGIAEAAPIPVVACQAWQLLAALVRWRDLDEATACLERSRSIAIEHRLPIWEIHALVRLGSDDAMRTASVERLEQVRQRALRVGAVTAACQAEQTMALQEVLTGDFSAAATRLDSLVGTAARLKLIEILQYVLLTRAILEAHQGRRREMELALAEFRECGGEQSHHASRVFGLGRSFCALLEENRERALTELAHARAIEGDNPTYLPLAGQHGLGLLLSVLSGEGGQAEYDRVQANGVSKLRWNRQFLLLTGAVLAARAGRLDEAEKAVAEAIEVAEPFVMTRHLCLRLIAEESLNNGGWGSPVEWLRAAEGYFHALGVTAVSNACRALMRRAGVPVPQRRDGVDSIPGDLRAAGLTPREYEVLRLLGRRLTNREIADALHLSTRTVEKHVGNLITKTGQADRIALAHLVSGPRTDGEIQ